MSCSAPRPLSAVAVAPPSSTIGDWAIWAFLTAVIVLVRPGPAVTAATPGRPVSRATASAANTAVASWRVSITRMPRRLQPTRIGEIWPPLSVNRNGVPCAARTHATKSPPSIGASQNIQAAGVAAPSRHHTRFRRPCLQAHAHQHHTREHDPKAGQLEDSADPDPALRTWPYAAILPNRPEPTLVPSGSPEC